MAKRGGLGKGYTSLIRDVSFDESDNQRVVQLKITNVEPNKEQPRKDFDEEKLEALTESIKIHGVIQPILVVKNDDRYVIVAGERRWRASKKAGLKEIPAIVCEYDNKKVMEVALIENLQREDLNPVEEALGYKSLMDTFDMTQEKISESVGKSRSVIANSLRILTLPEKIINYIKEGKISTGHAKAILSQKTDEEKLLLAKEIIEKGLTVRDAEKFKKIEKKEKKEDNIKTQIAEYITELETKVSKSVGNRVKIKHKNGKGKIEIEYYSNDDLERIINLLN